MGSVKSARGNSRSSRGRGGRSYSANFDPLGCYRCGICSHLARDCPKLEQRCREVEMLSLPNVNSLNPGRKAQEVEAEVGLFDSGASTSCMTRPRMSTRCVRLSRYKSAASCCSRHV